MRIMITLVLAAIGASLGGLLGELVARHLGSLSADVPSLVCHSALWYVSLGVVLGAGLGLANAMWRGSWALAKGPIGLGAAGGVVGGVAGLLVFYLVAFSAESYAYDAIFSAAHIRNPVALAAARACGMGVLGAITAGAATPVPEMERRGRAAAIGAGIGGLAGGLAFELLFVVLGVPMYDSPYFAVLRGMGVGLTGGLIGLGAAGAAELSKRGDVVVLTGPCEGRRLPLHRGRNVVGRASQCQVPLPEDLTVEPWHAAITWEVDHFVLHDASGGKTRVNGEIAARTPLSHGDRIRLGNAILLLELRGRARAQPAVGRVEAVAAIGETRGEAGQVAESPATQFVLVGARGLRAGRRYPIPPNARTLGRLRTDVVIDDPSVSRTHATLEVSKHGVTLRDAGSANGILVAGKRVEVAELRVGDEVGLGSTVFVLERMGG